jgi:cathepsin B
LYSRFQGLTKLQLKSFLGLLPDPKIQAAKAAKLQQSATANRAKRAALPAQFNASTKWPSCKSVFETIQDQSNCGSCWAVSTASVISDRRCILYNSPQLPTSSWDLVSCCDTCRADSNGCNGGWPTEAFDFYINTGVVTGGSKFLKLSQSLITK